MFAKEREIEALKRDATSEQDRNEVASQLLTRHETDLQASRKRLEALQEKQAAARQQFSLYTRTLQETEAQLARLTTVGCTCRA